MMPNKKPIEESLLENIKKIDDGCWLWTGHITQDGYGGLRGTLSHRVSYEYFKGKIPEELEIDDLCRNRACCNPDHLEAVTHKVNVNRGISKERSLERTKAITHCPRGHEYAGKNLRIKKTPTGTSRQCRKCANILKKNSRIRLRQQS